MQESERQKATTCYMCGCKFSDPGNYKVKDHCHITGNYRGPAHKHCNNNNNYKNYKIPVFFHN